MPWEVEFTDEFEGLVEQPFGRGAGKRRFWGRFTPGEGTTSARSHADTVHGSKYSNMKELRCQHQGSPYRVLFAFDPRRVGMLLIGGDKTWNPSWYNEYVPKADSIYEQHLKEIEKEQRRLIWHATSRS